MNLAGTILVYLGMAAGAAGILSLAKPLKFVKIDTRRMGAAVATTGALIFVLGGMLPAPLIRAGTVTSRIDSWMPEWQFDEFHEKRVHGTPEQVYRAIHEVTGDEIFLLRTLTWIRNPRWRAGGAESVLNPPGEKPILEVAQKGGFRLLAEDAPREVVLGTLVHWDGVTRAKDEAGLRALLATPGNAFATINFRVRDDGDGWCQVSTETRVYATDASTRRRFAFYWRVIYPGSSLLRYTWLNAIARRAERAPTAAP